MLIIENVQHTKRAIYSMLLLIVPLLVYLFIIRYHSEMLLDYAISHKSVFQIRLLLLCGAPVNIVYHNGQRTPLIVAIRTSDGEHTEIVKLLLNYHANPNLRETHNGLTPLHYAIKLDKDEMIKLLVSHNVDVNLPSYSGRTPLMNSILLRKYDIAIYLLNNGADPNICDNDGNFPLLVSMGMNDTALVSTLLEHQANVNEKDKSGLTPLHIAAVANRIDYAELLLSYHAKINALSDGGITPLHLAAYHGNSGMITYLLRQGANPRIQTDNGYTAYTIAQRQKQYHVLALLK